MQKINVTVFQIEKALACSLTIILPKLLHSYNRWDVTFRLHCIVLNIKGVNEINSGVNPYFQSFIYSLIEKRNQQ